MKLIVKKLVIFGLILPGVIQAEPILIDQIEVVVCGPVDNTPFTDTDAHWKKNLDSQPVRLDQRIQQEIIRQQAEEQKMALDSDAAKKYVESLKKQNNLDDSDLRELFAQIGCTYQEGIDVLNSQYLYEMFMHHKFKSQLVATDDAIREYFEEHPEWLDGWCEIQLASIPFKVGDEDSKQQAWDLAKAIIAGTKPEDAISWSSTEHIYQDDLAKDKQFIFEMELGQINVHEMPDGLELYKMVSKEQRRLKTLEERKFDIVDQLNYKKLGTLFEAYNKQVQKYFDIINMNSDIHIDNSVG